MRRPTYGLLPLAAPLAALPLVGLLTLATTVPRAAVAAEVTDMPDGLQLSGGFHYGGNAEWNALQEAEVDVAGRRIQRHDLSYHLEFSPVTGAALVLDVDTTPSLTYAYSDARTMSLEPVGGGGTYLLSEPGEDAKVEAGGLNGVWIGAALGPFAERFDRGNHQSTWRLDLAFRTGSANRNLWTAPDGKRGSSPGGSALKLQGAFSSDKGVGNPWMQFTYVKENKVTVDVVDEEGTTWAKALELQPASTVDAACGIEVVAMDDRETGARFALDLFMGFGYRTWEDIASGVYLPNVADSGRQIPMTTGDYLQGRLGFAFDYHVNSYVRARLGPDVRMHTPFRPEHLYDVHTKPENVGVGWVFRLDGSFDFDRDEAE